MILRDLGPGPVRAWVEREARAHGGGHGFVARGLAAVEGGDGDVGRHDPRDVLFSDGSLPRGTALSS